MGIGPERILLAYNKVDAGGPVSLGAGGLRISAVTGEGLDALRRAVVEKLETLGVAVPVYGSQGIA
jgi:50S ribosomal subunit-associated GTPase HflX